MDAAVPVGAVPFEAVVERRRGLRWPFRRTILGHASAVDRPVTLHDIGPGGFSARSDLKLMLGAAYDFQFTIAPYTVLIAARLAHALRISDDQGARYLLGFEFVDAQRDEAA